MAIFIFVLFIQENAALYDEIAHLEEKFVRAKEERRFVEFYSFVIFYT